MQLTNLFYVKNFQNKCIGLLEVTNFISKTIQEKYFASTG